MTPSVQSSSSIPFVILSVNELVLNGIQIIISYYATQFRSTSYLWGRVWQWVVIGLFSYSISSNSVILLLWNTLGKENEDIERIASLL